MDLSVFANKPFICFYSFTTSLYTHAFYVSVPSRVRLTGQIKSACHAFLHPRDKAACDVLLMVCFAYAVVIKLRVEMGSSRTRLMIFIEINWTRHTNSENVCKESLIHSCVKWIGNYFFNENNKILPRQDNVTL